MGNLPIYKGGDMFKNLTLIIGLVVLSGCSMRHQVQTTSGQSFLSQYQSDVDFSRSTRDIKKEGKAASDHFNSKVSKAAQIEPILRFPARIGVVRVENGSVTDVPQSEVGGWTKLSESHNYLGELVFVNVLGMGDVTMNRYGRPLGHSPSGGSIEAIRLAAARQHLDAVLIYELGVRTRKNKNALSVVDITLVGGAFLPTRSITAKSNARALLLDVRNGYPYGSAYSDSELKNFSTSWNSQERSDVLKERALVESYKLLMPKVDKLFVELHRRMKSRLE